MDNVKAVSQEYYTAIITNYGELYVIGCGRYDHWLSVGWKDPPTKLSNISDTVSLSSNLASSLSLLANDPIAQTEKTENGNVKANIVDAAMPQQLLNGLLRGRFQLLLKIRLLILMVMVLLIFSMPGVLCAPLSC